MPSTVSSVNELHTGRGVSETLTTRSLDRVFQVTVNQISATVEADILASSLIPALGAAHPAYAGSKCSAREVALEDDNDLVTWQVTCTYEIPTSGTTSDPDPTNDPAKISFNSSQYSRTIEAGYQSGDTIDTPTEPLVNSAGQPFDPPIVQEDENMVISISRNERTISPSSLFGYRNTLNSAAITVASIPIAIHAGRMRAITAVKSWDSAGSAYWQVAYDIEVRNVTHIRRVLDIGYYTLNAGVLEKILDSDDELVTEPHLLDGSGAKGDPATPVFLPFQTYWAVAWSGLSLPSTH